MAGVISASSLIFGLNISSEYMFYIPLFTGSALLILFIILWLSIPETSQKWKEFSSHIGK